MSILPTLALLLLSAAPQQDDPDFQTTSLTGEELRTPPLSDQARQRLEANLERAKERLKASPRSHDYLIWLGRRTAYLGHFRQAAEIYSRALQLYPDSPYLLRHRGHRYISLRRFEDAVSDLQRAAELSRGKRDEIEPDGAPNALNIPTSTLQTNIYYHLGLAHYLQGNFEEALEAYRECLKRAKNDDMLVATSHWLYMTLRRLDRDEEAEKVLERIHPDMHVIENTAYFDLLLMYKGIKSAQDLWSPGALEDLQSATVGYGVGNWHLYNGRPDEARAVFEEILKQPGWASFGYIASEAEVVR